MTLENLGFGISPQNLGVSSTILPHTSTKMYRTSPTAHFINFFGCHSTRVCVKYSYTRYSLVVANAYFRGKELRETDAFFNFLLDQSEQRNFLEIYLEPYCGVHNVIVTAYKFNKDDGWCGWWISCEDLKLTMG